MLARSSRLFHKPSCVAIQTPMLVPSFSSKGFYLPSGASEIGKILKTSTEFLTSTFLISAYDIAKGHIPKPEDMVSKPEIMILDSGGYEISGDNDLSVIYRTPNPDEEWKRSDLEKVLDAWPIEQPAIFVSYDNPKDPKPFLAQVAEARDLFKGRSAQLHSFLMKPHAKNVTVDEVLKDAVAHIDELGSFDIIGLTEKDLGSSMQDRIRRIAKLRRAMDEENIRAPIHIFGALDPLSSCVYFLAGAEIFDGLTWLRYAYDEDKCVYLHNHGALEFGMHIRDHDIKARTWSANYYYLTGLEQRMRLFCKTQELGTLPNSGLLKHTMDLLSS
jgi:hypothetical protein